MSNEVLNLSQAGLGINPLLTSVAQGYSNSELVGSTLFPRVPVPARHGQIVQFGKESFKKYNLKRAPGASTFKMDFGFKGIPFALTQDSIAVPLAREVAQDATTISHIDMASASINLTMDVMLLSLEGEQADLARNAALYAAANVYAPTGAAKWTDPSSDPIKDVQAAREQVRSRIGRYPNTMVVGAKVFAALKTHPKIVDRIKYTQFASVSTAMLADLFEVNTVKIGAAVTSDDNDQFSDIWGTDAILAYVPGVIATVQQPSFGYTYTLNGNPLVENAFYDNDAKAWIFGATYERAPYVTSFDSGFLFQAVA